MPVKTNVFEVLLNILKESSLDRFVKTKTYLYSLTVTIKYHWALFLPAIVSGSSNTVSDVRRSLGNMSDLCMTSPNEYKG